MEYAQTLVISGHVLWFGNRTLRLIDHSQVPIRGHTDNASPEA